MARARRSQVPGLVAVKSRPKISKSSAWNLSLNSSCHWRVSPAGVTISVRLALPRYKSACHTMPASMVFPRPTSSASMNRRRAFETTV
jgi:hypothetical protein